MKTTSKHLLLLSHQFFFFFVSSLAKTHLFYRPYFFTSLSNQISVFFLLEITSFLVSTHPTKTLVTNEVCDAGLQDIYFTRHTDCVPLRVILKNIIPFCIGGLQTLCQIMTHYFMTAYLLHFEENAASVLTPFSSNVFYLLCKRSGCFY